MPFYVLIVCRYNEHKLKIRFYLFDVNVIDEMKHPPFPDIHYVFRRHGYIPKTINFLYFPRYMKCPIVGSSLLKNSSFYARAEFYFPVWGGGSDHGRCFNTSENRWLQLKSFHSLNANKNVNCRVNVSGLKNKFKLCLFLMIVIAKNILTPPFFVLKNMLMNISPSQ